MAMENTTTPADEEAEMMMNTLKYVDQLVAQELENVNYSEIVNNKFKKMNTDIDENISPMMENTQFIFNQVLTEFNDLEKQQKKLRKEIHDLMDPETIIVDDDSPADTMSPKKTAGVAVQQNEEVKPKSKVNQESKPESPKHDDGTGLHIGLRVLAKKRMQWFPATVIDIIHLNDKVKYKVRFDMNRGKSKVQANHLACIDTSRRFSAGQILAGSRIAAHFKSEGIYSGVVAEAPDRKMNRGRFLIFFDDGYAMYCDVNMVYLVYSPPANVWDDISYRQTAEYIQGYLSTPERPMLSMKAHQILKVEFNGEWHRARCEKVDCSLVEVMYMLDNSREWIYRGSLRLEPLFKQSHMKMRAQQNKMPRRLARAHTGVRNAHIEYTTIDLTRDSSPSPPNSPLKDRSGRSQSLDIDERKKNVGKKSTGGITKAFKMLQGMSALKTYPPSSGAHRTEWKAPWSRSLAAQKPYDGDSLVTRLPQSYSESKGGFDVASRILDRQAATKERRGDRRRSADDTTMEKDGKVNVLMEMNRKRLVVGERSQNYSLFAPKQSARYIRHKCSPKCVDPFRVTDMSELRGVSPIMKPLYLGWTREVSRIKPFSRGPAFHVYYRTPCGRNCRNMSDVDRFMLETNLTELDYDQFCFDHSVRTHTNYAIPSRDAKVFLKDYANGKEDLPLPCVNEVNYELPPKMPYTKRRIPGDGVVINTSSDFMVCCDCPNNCRERSKCPCQQLTIQATSCSKSRQIKTNAGYTYKRLHGFLPTGIYECNPNCKCNMGCPNRVVQKGLQCRLQIFNTQKKGWGIRSLDDIAKGTFVCIYTGKIETETKADEEGLLNGDEYLAELDHIEVAERQKNEDDCNSSSGVESELDDDDDLEENVKLDSCKHKDRNDSGANTTDSEDDQNKHVTVTLKRNLDSKWTVKTSSFTDDKEGNSEDGSVEQEEEEEVTKDTQPDAMNKANIKRKVGYKTHMTDINITTHGNRRKLQNMKLGAGEDNSSSESDEEISFAYDSTLIPPDAHGNNGGAGDSDDEDSTDTDTEYSSSANGNSRPSSVCDLMTANKNNSDRKTGTQSTRMRCLKFNNPNLTDSSEDEEEISQTRKYFGSTETFIIDAKQTGNLGRYLNHSCMPNLLVQNVFIDTHDLRFPWVAFFASSTIRAGTELTWDYNYEIGSVEGREIPCYCGATKCRKRLL